MTGLYAMHYAVSGCPIAAKTKLSGTQTKVLLLHTHILHAYSAHIMCCCMVYIYMCIMMHSSAIIVPSHNPPLPRSHAHNTHIIRQTTKGPTSTTSKPSVSSPQTPPTPTTKPRPKKPLKDTPPKSVARRSRRLVKQSPNSDSSPFSASSDDDTFQPTSLFTALPLPPKRRKISPPMATRGSKIEPPSPPSPSAWLEGEGEEGEEGEERKTRRKRIPYTLVEASKGNRCPTPGERSHHTSPFTHFFTMPNILFLVARYIHISNSH